MATITLLQPQIFFRKYNKIDNILLSGRCNDIGHPFGGKFQATKNGATSGHNGIGHQQGLGIDVRYSNSEKAGSLTANSGTPIDLYDQIERKQQIDSMSSWATQLNLSYTNPQLHTDLKNLCSDSAITSCTSLSEESTSIYSEQSIRMFCHLESTRGYISNSTFNIYCGNFPKLEAIELAKSTEEIGLQLIAL